MSETATAPPDDYETASEILGDALRRVQREREGQAGWVAECRDNLRYGLEMLRQAEVAEAGLRALIASEAFACREEAHKDEPRPVLAEAVEPEPIPTVCPPVQHTPETAAALSVLASAAVDRLASLRESAEPEAPTPPVERQVEVTGSALVHEAIATLHERGEGLELVAKPAGPAPTLQERPALHQDRALAALKRLADADGCVTGSLSWLAGESGVPQGSMTFVLQQLEQRGDIAIQKNPSVGNRVPRPNTYRLIGTETPEPDAKYAPDYSEPACAVEPEAPGAPHAALTLLQTSLLSAFRAMANREGEVSCRRADLLARCPSLSAANFATARDALVTKRFLRIVAAGHARQPTSYRVLMIPRTATDRAAWADGVSRNSPSLEVAKIDTAKVSRAPLSELPVLPPERQPRPARAIPAADCPATPAPAPDKPLRIPVEFDEVWLTPEGPPGSLATLRHDECRWPTNTPPVGAGHLTTFCAAKALEDGPYCELHEARAHGGSR